MRQVKRFLMAQYRDFKILIREFKWSLLAFVLIESLGALLLYDFYTPEKLTFVKSLYAVFGMIFFQSSLLFPAQWYLQILFFIIPLIGLGVVVEGFARFGALVINKSSRKEAWYRVIAGTYENHVIVCGLGQVGYRIVEELSKLQEEVVVIEKDKDAAFAESLVKKGIPLIVGSAQDEALLEDAGIKKAKALVIATDNDLANLETAFNARTSNPGIRIVMRLFDARLATKVQAATNIDVVFSSSSITAPVAAVAAVQKGVLHSFYVGGQLVHLAEKAIDPASSWKGKTVAEAEADNDITVVVHECPGGFDLHPSHDKKLEAGDRVVFLSSLSTLAKIRKVL